MTFKLPLKSPALLGLKNVKKSSWSEKSKDFHDVYRNIEEYKPSRKCDVLIVSDEMIADLISNKNTYSNSNWTICYRKKNKHFFCFITQSYLQVPKDIDENFRKLKNIMKIPNKQELQEIACNSSSDIGFEECELLQKIYCKTINLFDDLYYYRNR